MKTNWITWPPFQSPQAREICAHLTSAEQAELTHRSGLYGFWTALTFALPLSVVITAQSQLFRVIAGALIAVHLACIPIWRQRQRQFLSSTAWALEKGIAP